MHRLTRPSLAVLVALSVLAPRDTVRSQESRARWDRLCQIRREKFDRILPAAMRENGIDLWIVAQREGHDDPLAEDLGGGYTMSVGYFVFTLKGDRVERAALGIEDHHRAACGDYDIPDGEPDIAAFVKARDPRRIGIDLSREMGGADGLSHTLHEDLVKALGPTYAARLVSAEKLASDFRSRRVASELVAFGEAGERSRRLAERALSNEVIVPGVTTLADVAWWIRDRMLEQGLGSSFGAPSVYVTGPDGIAATSNERIIQRGDLLMIDYGVEWLQMRTDIKRIAYVLRPGETAAPAGLQRAFDQAMKVRDVIRRTIVPGPTAKAMLARLEGEIAKAGFPRAAAFNRIRADSTTEFFIGCHSVGNQGHDIGPSIAFFNPGRLDFEIRPSNLFSIELFAWTPAPEFGGRKVRIPLEDDAVVTERGVEWLYPANARILLVK